jgi:hypothetical protein
MSSTVVVTVIVALMFVVITEVVAAILPLILVVALVPRDERRDLADLLAAADSSRRLRLWPALRVAVVARRRERLGRGPVGPTAPVSPAAASPLPAQPESPPVLHRAKD